VSTVDEITAAIKGLSLEEREDLVARLPKILPEMDGDAKWEQIIHDPRPRPALEKFLEEVEVEYLTNPQNFRETSDEEFKRHS